MHLQLMSLHAVSMFIISWSLSWFIISSFLGWPLFPDSPSRRPAVSQQRAPWPRHGWSAAAKAAPRWTIRPIIQRCYTLSPLWLCLRRLIRHFRPTPAAASTSSFLLLHPLAIESPPWTASIVICTPILIEISRRSYCTSTKAGYLYETDLRTTHPVPFSFVCSDRTCLTSTHRLASTPPFAPAASAANPDERHLVAPSPNSRTLAAFDAPPPMLSVL